MGQCIQEENIPLAEAPAGSLVETALLLMERSIVLISSDLIQETALIFFSPIEQH